MWGRAIRPWDHAFPNVFSCEWLVGNIPVIGPILSPIASAVPTDINYDIWIQGDGMGNYDVISGSTKSGLGCSALLHQRSQTEPY